MAMNRKRRVALLIIMILATGCAGDWRTASRESAGMAPPAASTYEAVIQVYGAPIWGWRGWFAIHPWIAMKPEGADRYTVYEVIGWRLRRGQTVVRIAEDIPDRYWYGERPTLLLDRRGEEAGRLIPMVDQAARDYPWPDDYRAFPGPNSNTFPAWIARQVPELGLALPLRAIGKRYVDRAPDMAPEPALWRRFNPSRRPRLAAGRRCMMSHH